jgi:aryl-alcohol dehydrogenase-like predicted oxidoreductase
MHYVRLGRAGLKVSRICLGCMSFGDPAWRPWVLDEDDARPIFRAAVEAGVTFFDTADFYSLGRSEEITGRMLRDLMKRDDAVIATKVGLRMGQGANAAGLSRKHIIEGAEGSLRRLKVDHIDLYQIHRLDRETPPEEILAALDHLVTSGKVLYLGASSMWAWEFMRLLGLQDRLGLSRFVSMQNHYNLLYREEEREMLPLCREEGVGVIPWSPLARGLLARGQPQTVRAASDPYANDLYGAAHEPDVIAEADTVALRHGRTRAQVALAWLLSRPGVTAPIVGATRLAHLEQATAALDVTLGADDLAMLEAPYRPRLTAGID